MFAGRRPGPGLLLPLLGLASLPEPGHTQGAAQSSIGRHAGQAWSPAHVSGDRRRGLYLREPALCSPPEADWALLASSVERGREAVGGRGGLQPAQESERTRRGSQVQAEPADGEGLCRRRGRRRSPGPSSERGSHSGLSSPSGEVPPAYLGTNTGEAASPVRRALPCTPPVP